MSAGVEIVETKLSERLSPAFVGWMQEAAERSGRLTVGQVYTLWREYSTACSSYDQSPVWSEFTEWYREQLKPVS